MYDRISKFDYREDETGTSKAKVSSPVKETEAPSGGVIENVSNTIVILGT